MAAATCVPEDVVEGAGAPASLLSVGPSAILGEGGELTGASLAAGASESEGAVASEGASASSEGEGAVTVLGGAGAGAFVGLVALGGFDGEGDCGVAAGEAEGGGGEVEFEESSMPAGSIALLMCSTEIL